MCVSKDDSCENVLTWTLAEVCKTEIIHHQGALENQGGRGFALFEGMPRVNHQGLLGHQVYFASRG